MPAAIADPEDVLSFWFDPPATDSAAVFEKVRRWFMGGAALDAEVIERFGATIDAAVTGGLEAWAATPRGRLALVLVLDQFTRNAYRGDPKTWSGDPRAQQLALEAFDTGLDRSLSHVEKLFLSMPLLHSESRAHHARMIEIAETLRRSAPPEYAQMSAMHVEQARKYDDVIARFGRFPHRNAILGRRSTPEEEAFLVDWEHKAPPSGSPPRDPT